MAVGIYYVVVFLSKIETISAIMMKKICLRLSKMVISNLNIKLKDIESGL